MGEKEGFSASSVILPFCFLNRFTLPLFGVTKEARARQAYLERKDRGFRRCFPGLACPVQATDQTDAAILRVCAAPWR